MKDITKKVVILENLSSPYVHQAIIVMRDFDPKLESRAVTEAERIVSAYLDDMKINSGSITHVKTDPPRRAENNGRNKKTARRFNRFLFTGIIAAVSIAIALVILRY